MIDTDYKQQALKLYSKRFNMQINNDVAFMKQTHQVTLRYFENRTLPDPVF